MKGIRRWWYPLCAWLLLAAAALAQQTGGGGVPGSGSGGGGGATIPATTSLLKGSGSSGSATAAAPGTDYIAPAPAAAQAVTQPTGTTLGVNNLNNTFYVDGFPSSCTVSAVNYTTQADCAFYTAKAYTTANSVNTRLVFGQGSYSTNASFVEPVNLYAVNLFACGIFCTHLTYTGSSAIPVISRADGGSNFTFLQIKDMTIDGGGVASSIMDLFALNQSVIQNISAVNIAPGQDHFIKFGSSGGDNYQLHASNLNLYAPAPYNSPSQYATVTANVAAGSVTSYTVVNGGSGYPGSTGLTVAFTGFQNGTSYAPCTTMPTATATVSGGVVTAVTPVTNGSGCTGTVDVQVYNLFPVNYGVIWNASDSTGDDIVSYVGSIAGIQVNGGNSVFHHLHPALIPVGIQNNTNSAFEGTELDSIYKFGFDFEFISGGAGTSVYGTSGYSGNRVIPGESTYYFGAGAGNTIFGAQGNLCNGTKPTDWHEFVTQAGTVDQGARYPAGVSVMGNDRACGTTGDYTPQLGAKVINGVSYSSNYPGSTLDVRVNACITDAETMANGNSSGICDSTGEGGTQSIAAPILVGNAAMQSVTWKLPPTCAWTASGFPSNGTSAVITQHAGSTILGPVNNWTQCTIFDTNAFIGAVYQTVEQGYYRAEGFQLYNGGYTVALGATMVINGAIDTSAWSYIGILHQTAASAAMKVVGSSASGSICCAATFDHIQANSNNQGGIVLDLEGSSAGEPIAVSFIHSTFTHPKTGQPAILCNDTATNKSSQVEFFDTYIETGNTDKTTALIQNTGCAQLLFQGLNITDPSMTSTATGITNSNAFAASIIVDGLTQFAGFSQPATGVVNSYTSETIATDANGHLSGYKSGIDYATRFNGPSFNGLALTPNATGFSLAGGTTSKTITVNNSLTLAGTDGTTMTFPGASDTVATLAAAQSLSNKTVNGLTLTANATGFGIAGGTTSKSLTINNSLTLAGTDGTTYTMPAATGTLAATNAANNYSAAQVAPGFWPQSKAAGPYATLFDDYFSGANNASNNIGAPTGASCAVNTTYTDMNHPGNILLTSGTAGTGTGITCGYQSQNPSVLSPNSATLGWSWESAVYVPVLPGTTVGSYQAGLTAGPTANPWTTGIEFYLSSANSVTNDWYCRYSATSIDSTVAAAAATWTRLTMVNDGTFVHWYINGTEATGCKTAVGSMPSAAQYPASWSATALSATSVLMSVDYVDFQRATAR